MFWKHNDGQGKLPGPKDIPELAGRYMVVQEKQDPDWVWKLKGVLRPAEKKDAFYCRVFDGAKTAQAGVKVSDFTSLDGHLELILWEGYLDKETNTARREKFVQSFS